MPFFWAPKETKAARGCFPSPPLATRKLLIPPTKEKIGAKLSFAPLSKGAKGKHQQAEKRDGGKHTSKDKAEMINRVCFFAIKADGKKCRPLSVNFNLISLSRARKF